jgi:hypothetical protein
MEATMALPKTKPHQLSQYFSNDEILTSSELIQRLCQSGLSQDNARQSIHRHAELSGLWHSSNLKLPRNERLFALAAFRKNKAFLGAIGKKLQAANRQALARCLSVLERRPALNRVDVLRLLAVSPTPANQQPQTLTRMYDGELAALKELGVDVIHSGTALEALRSPVQPTPDVDAAAAGAAENLRKEAIIARVLVDRMRQQNVLAWDGAELPEPATPYVEFNDQVFTASGFSYLSPLVRWKQNAKKPTPCPVLVDCYYDQCTVSQVASFAQRLQRVAHRGKSRMAVLGIIAARDFTTEAWDEARRHGFMAINLRQAFGSEALDVMAQIEGLIHHVNCGPESANQEEELDHLTSMIGELKVNPVVVSLRAIGFEILTGFALRSLGYDQVELGRLVPWQQTTRDVDVFGMKGDELHIIECKAYHGKKSISREDVRKFFTETVLALKVWLRTHDRPFEKCIAEIWTTGLKGKDAGDTLYALNRPTTDEWGIARIQEISGRLPRSIRSRSMEFLKSIATTETDGTSSGTPLEFGDAILSSGTK